MKKSLISALFPLFILTSATNAYANRCESKFKNHSALSAQVAQSTSICKAQFPKWSFWGINGIGWDDYFECFDNMAPYAKYKKQFYRECLYRNTNDWMRSDDQKECLKISKQLAPDMIGLICLNPIQGKSMIEEEFKTCFSQIERVPVSTTEKIDNCTTKYGQQRAQCVAEMDDTFDKANTWNLCGDYNTRNTVLRGKLKPCLDKLSTYGIDKNDALKTCSSTDRDDAIACIENNQDTFELDVLAVKCAEKSFRQANRNKYFPTCLSNAKNDGMRDGEAIDLCSQNDDLIEIFATSDDFKSCKESVTENYAFTMKNAYASCSDDLVRSKFKDQNFMACFESGINSAMLGYFDYRAKEMENRGFSFFNQRENNPYFYVIDNCLDDIRRKPYQKRNNYLKLWKDYNIHSNTVFKKAGMLLGGLSALRFDLENNKLYFLSDDKGFHGSPRIYVYDYTVNESGMGLKESNLISFTSNLKGKKSANYTWRMDPEGLDFTAEGDIVISSEVDNLSDDNAITVFNPKGVKKGNVKIAEDFVPGKAFEQKGMQHNKGFEALSISPDKTRLFIANEGNLKQDEDYNWKKGDCWRDCVVFSGEVARIVEYNKSENGYEEKAQYYYRMDNEADNGISEILSLDNDNLLVLERSWDNKKRKITSKVYHVSLKDAQAIPEKQPEDQEQTEEEPAKDEESPNRPDQHIQDNAPRIIEEPVIRQSTDFFDRPMNGYQGNIHYSMQGQDSHNPQQQQQPRRRKTGDDIESIVLKKTLVIDLDDILGDMAPGFRRLENFEGIALGPVLPNGNPSLVIIADNNFSLNQRTLLLILEMNPKAFERLKE